jgi:tRNA pseudouridine38-40 synthase
MRYFLRLSYDGTHYAGWQTQPNALSVQQSIEDALQTLLRKECKIMGCGRTDKGVHARNYVAHLDIEDLTISEDQLLYKLNSILNKDIACHALTKVAPEAHARFDAISRSYVYHIHYTKTPFKGRYSTYMAQGALMNEGHLCDMSDLIKRSHSFGSFCKLHGDASSMLCDIKESYWQIEPEHHKMAYHITANRFLRGMVRLIVGTSMNVALGKLSLSEVEEHMRQGTRSPLMHSAPPQGLSLVEINYPDYPTADILAS